MNQPLQALRSPEDIHAALMRKVDESLEATKKYGGHPPLFMHFSALKKTSRKSHTDRHGKLFSASEVREFWNDPKNCLGCTCTVIPVPVDKGGNPIAGGVIKRANEIYQKIRIKHGADWV